MIDLKFNYPTVSSEALIIKDFIASQNNNFEKFLSYPNTNTDSFQNLKKFYNIPDHLFENQISIIPCLGGNHALSCLASFLKICSDEIITEPYTYSVFRKIASERNLSFQSVAIDQEGMKIDELEKILYNTKARILYLQPTIQNPTCSVMSLQRRIEIAALVKKKDLLIIEDDAYRFLHPNPPLRFLDLIPSHTVHIFSLSKPFNCLLKSAFVCLPKRWEAMMQKAVRLSTGNRSSLLASLADFLLTGDRLNHLIEEKRVVAENLQNKIQAVLKGYNYQTFPSAFHFWWKIPKPIDTGILFRKMFNKNILISDGKEFQTDQSLNNQYIRIALGGENNIEKIKTAIAEIQNYISSN